jgi:hypothetical protein
MPLHGKGMLIVFNEVKARDERDFNEWYNREHMPERILGVPVLTNARTDLGELSKDAQKREAKAALGKRLRETSKSDWREVKFLETIKKSFALSDYQMDVAMDTARQFPAVELGGHAPS